MPLLICPLYLSQLGERVVPVLAPPVTLASHLSPRAGADLNLHSPTLSGPGPCGGRLRFIALILDEVPAREILDSLDLPSRPPPIGRARAPDWGDPIPDDD
jgi:hypothetical protein